MATTCIARLTLTGDFEPDVVTNKVGIEPTRIWRKGDRIGRRSRLYEYSGWSIHSRKEESYELQVQVKKLISQIGNKWSLIAAVRKEMDLDAEIACSIIIVGTAPWIHFDPDVLELFVEMGAEIDVDIEAFSEDFGEDDTSDGSAN